MIRGAAVIVAALLLAAPARADGETDEQRTEARRNFEVGEAHFERGFFAEALAAYETGYKLARLPGFLINIAQCHRLMGELKKARAYYRKFLLIAPTSPRRQEIEDMIGELDKAIAENDAPTPAPAPAAARPRTVSPQWWIWSALASSMVGSTVAASALAATDAAQGPVAGQR